MIDTSDLDRVIADLRAGVVDDAIDDAAAEAIPAMARAAQESIRRAARPHRKTGRLESLVTVTVGGSGVQTVAAVAAGGVANIIVGGQRPHDIRPIAGRVLAFAGPVTGFAAHVRHPGTAPDPFVARGLAAARGDVDALVDDAAADMAAQVAARLEG